MDAKDTFSSRGNAGGQARSGPTAQDKQGTACRTEVRAGSDRMPPTHLGLAGAGGVCVWERGFSSPRARRNDSAGTAGEDEVRDTEKASRPRL